VSPRLTPHTVNPHLVILPSGVWRQEISDELVRLGVSAEQAPLSAGKVLHRICGHHGWPKDAIQVASSDEPDVDADADAEQS
jgi:hypothetical protein